MSARAVLLLALQAVPTPGPLIKVEAIQENPTQGHVFSQREIPLTLRVYGAQGRRLDLSVQPYQLAHALAAPVGPALEVAVGVELGKNAWHEFPFALACPAVDRAVGWELRFLARLDGEEAWQAAGHARLELHPPDLLGPLRALARDRQWFVSDAPGTLKAFLSREGIPFGDLDRPGGRDAWARSRSRAPCAPSDKGRSLVLCVRAPGPSGELPSCAVLEEAPCALVFEPTDLGLALRRELGRTRVTLDLGLIARLTDDPRAQIALVEAIELTRGDTLSDECSYGERRKAPP